MNDILTTTTAETNENAKALAPDILQAEKDINSVIAPSGVSWHFRTHYTNVATGDNGCKDLICRILMDRQAVFARNAEETDLRQVVVSTSLFADEIAAKVQETFGPERYPLSTIQCDLQTLKKQGKIHIVILKKPEDKQSKTRPRRKFYLLEKASTPILLHLDGNVCVDIGTKS